MEGSPGPGLRAACDSEHLVVGPYGADEMRPDLIRVAVTTMRKRLGLSFGSIGMGRQFTKGIEAPARGRHGRRPDVGTGVGTGVGAGRGPVQADAAPEPRGRQPRRSEQQVTAPSAFASSDRSTSTTLTPRVSMRPRVAGKATG